MYWVLTKCQRRRPLGAGWGTRNCHKKIQINRKVGLETRWPKKKWISLSPSSSPFMLLIALGWVAWHLSLLPWNKLCEGSDVVCLVHNSVPRAHHGDETRPGLKHTEREDLNSERHDCLLISSEATQWRGKSRVFGRSSHSFVHSLIRAFVCWDTSYAPLLWVLGTWPGMTDVPSVMKRTSPPTNPWAILGVSVSQPQRAQEENRILITHMQHHFKEDGWYLWRTGHKVSTP